MLAADLIATLPAPAILLDAECNVLHCHDDAARLLQLTELRRFCAHDMAAKGWQAEHAEAWQLSASLAAGATLRMAFFHLERPTRCRITVQRLERSGWFLLHVHAGGERPGDLSPGDLSGSDLSTSAGQTDRLLQCGFEQAPIGIMLVDTTGAITHANAQLRAQVGLSEGDVLLGQNALTPPNPDHVRTPSGRILPVHDWPLTRALRDAEVTASIELLCERRDGKSVWRNFAASPLIETGQLCGAVLVSRDSTIEHELSRLLSDMNEELSQKGIALEQREQLLEAALDQAPVMVHMVQSEGLRTIMLNAFGRQLLGVDQDQYLNLVRQQSMHAANSLELLDHERQVLAIDDWPIARAARGETVDEQLLIYRRGNEEHRLLCSAVPVKSPSGDTIGAIMLAVDLTERQRLEEQRRRLLARVKEAERLESVGILAGQLAHELNNILATIMGHADLAMSQLGADHEVQHDLLNITRAAERAGAELAQSLRITGQSLTMKEPLDVGALVREEIHHARSDLNQDVHLIIDVMPNLPLIRADRAGIRQLVASLFNLARRDLAGCMGEILVAVRIYDAALEAEPMGQLIEGIAPEGLYVELSIVDDGAGGMISELQRAFDPVLARASSPGLDLAVVRGTVRAHQGLIFAETAPQRGMRTTVLLPFSRETPTPE